MPIDRDLWDLFINFEERTEEATGKAGQICSEFLGPAWKGRAFTVEKVSGGVTNLVFKCSIPGGKAALLRIQVDKDVMQLQNELILFMKLAEHSLGPNLLGVFPGGRLEEFIPSRTLTPEECQRASYSQLIARSMAQIHRVDVPLPKASQLIPIMRQWVERIRKNGEDEFDLWCQMSTIPNKEALPTRINLTDMSREIDHIEHYMKESTSPCRLCHNDLYASNILLRDGYEVSGDGDTARSQKTPKENEKEEPLVLIDFEFGMYNYRGLDILNHLSELCIDYTEKPYLFEFNYFEDSSFQRKFCEAYLKELYRLLKESGGTVESEGLTGDLERDVALLEKEVDSFKAIIHLWWGVWNIICDQEGIIGLDFYNVWRDRVSLYFHLKNF